MAKRVAIDSISGTRDGAFSHRKAARLLYGVDAYWSRRMVREFVGLDLLRKVGRRKVCGLDLVDFLAYVGRDRAGRVVPWGEEP